MAKKYRYLYGQGNPTPRSLDPTACKRAVVAFILEFSTAHGYAPTVQEITDATNLMSKATTQKYLDELVTEGRLERDKKRTRTLRVIV